MLKAAAPLTGAGKGLWMRLGDDTDTKSVYAHFVRHLDSQELTLAWRRRLRYVRRLGGPTKARGHPIAFVLLLSSRYHPLVRALRLHHFSAPTSRALKVSISPTFCLT